MAGHNWSNSGLYCPCNTLFRDGMISVIISNMSSLTSSISSNSSSFYALLSFFRINSKQLLMLFNWVCNRGCPRVKIRLFRQSRTVVTTSLLVSSSKKYKYLVNSSMFMNSTRSYGYCSPFIYYLVGNWLLLIVLTNDNAMFS